MNYYNEFDPKAAAWLRELIKAGHIPNGEVDERSITEIKPTELLGYTQCHFFAGIGGWPLALALAGWPENRPVWTGSCPCQPFSQAGKQLADKDARHLWPVFCNLIRKCKPPTVFGEQVASKLGREWLAGVFTDLEGMGYAVAGADLCAAGVGAPHIRQRLYWVADSPRGRFGIDGGAQREAGHLDERGSLDRVAHPNSLPEHGISGERPGTPGEVATSGRQQDGELDEARDGRSISNGGVENSERIGREPGSASEPGCEIGNALTDYRGETCGMGNANSPRFSQQRGAVSIPPQQPPVELRGYVDPWGDYRIILCADGKARRVPTEPAFFPLAHGVSGRVGLLRGYGNAIVPQVAAEFIRAYSELRPPQQPNMPGDRHNEFPA